MPITTVDGSYYVEWNEAAAKKLQTYTLTERIENFRATVTNSGNVQKLGKRSDNNCTVNLGDATSAIDAAKAVVHNLKSARGRRKEELLGPVGGFDKLSKHWIDIVEKEATHQTEQRNTEFRSLFSHLTCHGGDSTAFFITSVIHCLLTGYTVITCGLFSEQLLFQAFTAVLRSSRLETISEHANTLDTGDDDSLMQFARELASTGTPLPSHESLSSQDADTGIKFNISTANGGADMSGGAGTLAGMPFQQHSVYSATSSTYADALPLHMFDWNYDLAETGSADEYRFNDRDGLKKRNHPPPLIATLNMSTNVALASSLGEFFIALFRTKHYQKELAARADLLKRGGYLFTSEFQSNSALSTLWQHLQILMFECMAQFYQLHNLSLTELMVGSQQFYDVVNAKTCTFANVKQLRAADSFAQFTSTRSGSGKCLDINFLIKVLPGVKLPKYIHIQLDCTDIPSSIPAETSNSKYPSIIPLLSILSAIPQITMTIKKLSLTRLHTLSPTDHRKFGIKYVHSLNVEPGAYDLAIQDINNKVQQSILSSKEDMLLQKELKECLTEDSLQDNPLLRALATPGNTPKYVTERNIAQISIILNHLSSNSKSRILLLHLLELQERVMKSRGYNLSSPELATEQDSVGVDELKESVLDVSENKSVIILAGQTAESILRVFMDVEATLQGGIPSMGKDKKVVLQSPLKRVQDYDRVGLYVECTYTGIITLLDLLDSQNGKGK